MSDLCLQRQGVHDSVSLSCFNFGENEQSKQNILFTTKITSQNLPTQAQLEK
jgi:hypothetical protein